MAIAAVLFLSSTTLSRGYPVGAFFATRQLLGGDIVLIPGKSALSREDLAAGGYTWRFQKKSLDRPDLVLGLDPLPYWYGTIQGVPTSGQPRVTAERYRAVVQSLQANGAVKYAAIRRSIPFLALLPPQADGSTAASYGYGFLDARDVAEDLETWQMGSVTSGQYLAPGDDPMVGVACAGWSGLPVSGRLTLDLPRYVGGAGTHVTGYLDYENSLRAVMTMKSVASFSEGGGVALRTMTDPVVFVARSTLAALAEAAGFPEEATYWGISATIKEMSELENVTALLRREFPDFTVLPASVLESAAGDRSSISSAVPMDMRRVTEAIAFITAALLSATNLTVLMLSRKNEIGILRALGATRSNIAVMVLTESVWIALLGSVAGSIVTQPAILWQLLSNRVASDAVMREIGNGMARAVGFSTVAATVFGFLPVARALRITPAQVLRGE
jgi:hypothetical protein